MAKNLLALVFAATSLIAASPQGENWTEFRGPTGQGHSTAINLPVEWKYESDNTAKNISWKQPVPGKGWSSPVFYDNNIYLTTAVPAKEETTVSLRAMCLDAGTGRTVWDVEVFSPEASARIHDKNSHASPTPLVEGGRLYVHFGHQGTACLDLKGNIIWRNRQLAYAPVHGNGGSPIVVDDALIFSCDGASEPFVVALNKNDGRVIWKTFRNSDARKKFSFSTPLSITVNGQKQVVSPASGVICAYQPGTGREIWRVRYAEGYSVVPRPVFGHGLVFFSTGFDRPVVMAVRPTGTGDVTSTHVAWTLAKSAPTTPSLLLAGDELYLVSDGGIASCVDARSGRVHWQERVEGNYSASPLYAGGKIYFQNEEGTAVVIKAGKEFEKLAVNPLHERTLASYAVGDGALFVRGERHLFKVQTSTQRTENSVPSK
jgi:outer membrane protein assembly factor BamB